MTFVFFDAALNLDGERDARLVARIMDRVADAVHRLVMVDADQLEQSTWYKGADPSLRQLAVKASSGPVRAIPPGEPHRKEVEVRTAEDLIRAERLAHSPLVILVEDREADGVLLELFVEECGSLALVDLWSAGSRLTPRAWEIDTAGGIGGIPDRIERAVEDARAEGRPVRLFVLCDSDRRWPDDTAHGSVKALRNVDEMCKQNSVAYHVLRKRCAENYIPDEVFEAVRDEPSQANHSARFDALLRLSSPQRDYFPIKDGLDDAERSLATAVGHYTATDAAQMDLLKERLLLKRPRPMKQLVPDRRSAFTRAGLAARDGQNEIEALLHALAAEL